MEYIQFFDQIGSNIAIYHSLVKSFNSSKAFGHQPTQELLA